MTRVDQGGALVSRLRASVPIIQMKAASGIRVDSSSPEEQALSPDKGECR
jgi:hypothetical protein